MARKAAFDGGAFYSALDATRDSRRLNWKQVAEETGVNASTLTRMGQGKRPDLDSLAALYTWAGLDPDDFVRLEGIERIADAEPLAKITALLRSDPRLDDHGASLIENLVRTTYSRVADS
ncbi:MAG TPA: helix-turn-helix transcriptional regulator [Gaiellaceae bacterium]